MNRIPIDQCINRRLYKLQCRNLVLGVYTSERREFIGLREKFDRIRVEAEYHYDNGAPYGTVSGMEDTGIDLPEEFDLCQYGPDVDEAGNEIWWDRSIDHPLPIKYKWPPPRDRGWYRYKDTGVQCANFEDGFRNYGTENKPLRKWLDEKHAEFGLQP